MITNNRKGQATVEYIILLAVAIVVALVILAFMGFIPGLAGSLNERQTKLYWSSTYPIQIIDYKFGATTSEFLLKNVGTQKVEITSMNHTDQSVTGLIPNGSAARLSAGEQKVFSVAGFVCDDLSVVAGNIGEFENVSIAYDNVGGITGQILRGDRNLLGRCTE